MSNERLTEQLRESPKTDARASSLPPSIGADAGLDTVERFAFSEVRAGAAPAVDGALDGHHALSAVTIGGRRKAWRISTVEIERVRQETDLPALVRSRGVELKAQIGRDLAGRCPFHADQEAHHFIVSPGEKLWQCTVCGAAGNAIEFLEKFDGISFRHAFELLAHGGAAAFIPPSSLAAGPRKRSTVLRLKCPLDAGADDATLRGQVLDYYQSRLSQNPAALDFLAQHGLRDEALFRRFGVGFADRSLGLRLPEKNRAAGAELRRRLQALGLWRESGHEHFNGCIVVSVENESGDVAGVYGRRLKDARSGLRHLYSPVLCAGMFNAAALGHERGEVILCETIFDALVLIGSGVENATANFGADRFTDDVLAALLHHKVRVVRFAYSSGEAAEQAAQRDAVRLNAHGIETYWFKLPPGTDANDKVLNVRFAGESLRLLPGGTAAATEHPPVMDEAVSVRSPVSAARALLERDGQHFLALDERGYRLSGLEKCVGLESLKVTLRLQWRDYFHADSLDLCRDVERRRFVERAAEETGLTPDLLKRDLGRLLLAVEQHQETRLREERAAMEAARAQGPAALSAEEEADAMALLRAPDLLAKIASAFEQCGIVGEDNNKLTAYLACISRLLEKPLAVIIQSTSAAGKTALMEAVLSFFPEEECVKYSAMTGQSLYYLGDRNLRHKILAIVEEEGAAKAGYALKLLQSEGELTIASTGKDPRTGRMVTQEYRVEGPVMIFLTTTAIDIDEELQNRCLTLAVDESCEQTARIHALQRHRRTLAGLIAREERRDILRVLRHAQRLLAPIAVLNPFAPELTFGHERTRTRRDHEKYLTLIDALALLHQHQRPRSTHTVNGRTVEYIEATLDDIATANRLAPDVLGRSLDELPPQTRRLYGHVRELVRSLMDEAKQPQARCHFSRRQLRERCGWSEFQVRVHLQRLEDFEYVARRFGRQGVNCVYELLLDVDAPAQVAQIGLLDVAELALKHGCERSFEGPGSPSAGPSFAPTREPQTKRPSASAGASAQLRAFVPAHMRVPDVSPNVAAES